MGEEGVLPNYDDESLFAAAMIRDIQAEIDREFLDDLREQTLQDQIQQSPIRGSSQSHFVDNGYFYAPYVPMIVSTSYTPELFMPQDGKMTRYGQKMLEEGKKYYGTSTISNVFEPEKPKPKTQLTFDWD